MVSLNPETEARRRALLSLIAQKRGYYAPPQASTTPPPTPEPAPSGFTKALRTVGKVAGPIFQGSKFADLVLPGDPGTEIKEKVSSIPYIGKPVAEGLDALISPFSVATLGYGGVMGAGLRSAGAVGATRGFSRLAAPLVEPLVAGSLKTRIGAELAANLGGQGAHTLAQEAGLPEPISMAAGLLGGAAGIRTVSNAAARAALTRGGLSADEVAAKMATGDATDKFTALLSTATRQNVTQESLRATERSARFGAGREAVEGLTDPTQRFQAIRRAQKGEMPTEEFTMAQKLEKSDIDAIHERVTNYFSQTGNINKEARAWEALSGLWSGKIPQQNEITLLSEALGTDFGMVLSKLGKNPSLWGTAIDAAGIPRAIMSSFDASMPFRQGLLGMSRKEWRQSWGPMIKSFHDGKYADAIAEDIATSTHPMVGLLRDTKIISATPDKMQSLEEGFTSGIAEIFPWVRQSERGALTFVNKFRADYAKNIYDGWVKQGKQFDQKDMDQLAKWTGIISGRGTLPKVDGSREAISLMNSLFFSPKFLFSRLQAVDPRTYMQMTPLVRKEAMRDMVGSLGPAIGAVTMLGMAGKAGILPGVSVETDPRSSDFGKVRLGQQRLDPFGGFQPLARYMAQFGSGQAKNSSGEVKDRSRVESVMNFTRGKLAPIPGFLVDALTGKDFTGQEVDVVTGGGLDRATAERLTPLFAQDLADAYRAEGYGGIAYAMPAAFGFSVQSYNSAAAIQQAGAKEMYGKNWKELTGLEQANVKAAKAEDLAKQSKPADDSVTALVEKVNTDTRAAEQELLAGLPTMGNKRFTDSMNDLMAARVNQIKGVILANGLEDGEDPTLLDKYFGLRTLATENGITDYEKLDELQNDFIQNLPQDQQRIIAERTKFQHVPGAEWWGDAKKVIADSEYYRLKGQTLDKLAPLVQRIAPGVTTYEELLAARAQAQEAGDVRQALVLQNLVKQVDKITKQYQKVYRVKNPEVDKALTLLYGSTPIVQQLAR